MDLASAIKKIDRYLTKDIGLPLIVDVQNYEDWSNIITHYNVDTTTIIKASVYCKSDELPQLDTLMSDLMLKEGNTILCGISVFLKLKGDSEQKQVMSTLINMPIKGHLVVVTFQLAKSLNITDPRLITRIVIVEGRLQIIPDIVFVSSSFNIKTVENPIKGINKLANILSNNRPDKRYIITNKKKNQFPKSLIYISEVTDAYNALIIKDSKTANLKQEYGTKKQWEYALSLFDGADCWETVIDSEIGNHTMLEMYIPQYNVLSAKRVWLYYIGLKLFETQTNWCLNNAIEHTTVVDNLIANLYKSLLHKSTLDEDYWDCYESRKAMLNQLGNPVAELSDYCKLVASKGREAIFYLTDNTQLEKEQIFKYLDQYGQEYSKEELLNILKRIYPDLSDYLNSYDFRNAMLTSYFDTYKYQKVVNKVFPEFIKLVEEQAEKREYNLLLQPRAAIVEGLNVSDSQLYFIDALGVEYLGYIVAQCHAMNLRTNIKVCRSELPSITSMNKEFLAPFEKANARIVSIKDIDEIKHHGKDDFDYYNGSKLPIHLIRELEIIHEALEKIKSKLLTGDLKRTYIISDHGASRLAVLHDTENIWEMKEKGQHSGRCCLKAELEEQPLLATDAGDYWALANYDRFKGGRKANVEVHGGATLEEICVPIIELTYQDERIEAFFLRVDDVEVNFDEIPEIEVSFRKKAAIKLFITSPVDEVAIVVNEERFMAESLGNGFYKVEMPELKKPDTYSADVYSGTNLIADGLKFIIKREGQQIHDLL